MQVKKGICQENFLKQKQQPSTKIILLWHQKSIRYKILEYRKKKEKTNRAKIYRIINNNVIFFEKTIQSGGYYFFLTVSDDIFCFTIFVPS